MKKVTFTVVECSDFLTLGECHEGIESLEEAVRIYESISSARKSEVKAIGIAIGEEQCDILIGTHFNFEALSYCPALLRCEEAMEAVVGLLKRYPFYTVEGDYPQALLHMIMKEGTKESFMVPLAGIHV